MPQRMDSCRDRGRREARPRAAAWEGAGKETQTHVKELAGTKRVVGDLPLLGSPRAIQEAVPNHGAFIHAGVNVQGQVP